MENTTGQTKLVGWRRHVCLMKGSKNITKTTLKWTLRKTSQDRLNRLDGENMFLE